MGKPVRWARSNGSLFREQRRGERTNPMRVLDPSTANNRELSGVPVDRSTARPPPGRAGKSLDETSPACTNLVLAFYFFTFAWFFARGPLMPIGRAGVLSSVEGSGGPVPAEGGDALPAGEWQWWCLGGGCVDTRRRVVCMAVGGSCGGWPQARRCLVLGLCVVMLFSFFGACRCRCWKDVGVCPPISCCSS